MNECDYDSKEEGNDDGDIHPLISGSGRWTPVEDLIVIQGILNAGNSFFD